ncbi:MAG: MFS transporter [Legionellaceae bacterium]|nr:MFS transporter [Legionellaceae bacterium]
MLNKNIVGSFLGSVSEWYEFVVYAFCAPFLAPLFFPSHNKFASILAVFGAFAVGFFMRPLGALVFGYFGDKYGRQKTVSIAVILIGLPTVVMGLMPTYESIGMAAPIILLLVRMLQGLSVGGQFTGSAVFITEHIGTKQRYLGSGITFAGAFIGMLIASAVGSILTATLSEAALAVWGWRVPFLLGIFVAIMGYYLKTSTSETPEFIALMKKGQCSNNPILDAIKTEKMNMLRGCFICWLTPIIVYQLFIFMPTYAERYLDISLSVALKINTFSMVFLAGCSVFFGYLADKIGFEKVMLTAALLFALCGYPLYGAMITYQSVASLAVTQFIFAVLGGAFIGPMMGVLTHLFSVTTRYTALSISYNLGFGLFGGTAALFNMIFIEHFNLLIFPAIYLSIAAAISFGALMRLRHRNLMNARCFA